MKNLQDLKNYYKTILIDLIHLLNDIYSWSIGNLRYKLYNSRFRFLVPKWVRDYYILRLRIMNPICLSEGACIECGCITPALQFANKTCDGECYPPMTNKKDFNMFINGEQIIIKDDTWQLSTKKQGKIYYHTVYRNYTSIHESKTLDKF